jgi:hypothetical protein
MDRQVWASVLEGLQRAGFVRKIFGLVAAVAVAVQGIGLLRADECESVSFRGQGKAVAILQCFADDSGAIASSPIAIGLIVLGVVLAVFTLKR